MGELTPEEREEAAEGVFRLFVALVENRRRRAFWAFLAFLERLHRERDDG